MNAAAKIIRVHAQLHPPGQRKLDPWHQIARRADAFFDQVQRRFPAQLLCQAGCSLCCQHDLSVLLLEALVLLEGLDALAPQDKKNLLRRDPTETSCALLVEQRCLLYPRRPLICRTHGLPLIQQHQVAAHEEEHSAVLSCCSLNFKGGLPPSGYLLDETTLTAMVTVADALLRQELGLDASLRVDIGDLVRCYVE